MFKGNINSVMEKVKNKLLPGFLLFVRSFGTLFFFVGVILSPGKIEAQIVVDGKPAVLEIREVTENSIRITLKPVDYGAGLPFTPALAEDYPVAEPSMVLQGNTSRSVKRKINNLEVEVTENPLGVIVKNKSGEVIQNIIFDNEGGFSFIKSDSPVLGMGEGGPHPSSGVDWRNLPVQFDRNGSYQNMIPRWQSDAYGSRNPVALMVGTDGWAIFVATPWGKVDLTKEGNGFFIPEEREGQNTVQNVENQGENKGKGLPPAEDYEKGLLDIFVFDAHNPPVFMKDISIICGPAVMPPKWSLGYMQSHRTISSEDQILGIVDTFRSKQIPIDAVIYLGTGFCPSGWNTPQPSFEFNPEVFTPNPKEVLTKLHDKNVKVVLHVVPLDRDKLPTLHGTIPARSGEVLDVSHIQNYWEQHFVGLMDKGADAFWPDEGDWFNLFERVKRHQMHYQGPVYTKGIRSWSLHRNGYLGIAKWGGWVWSGDTQSSWKTLEAQIAVGLNYSLSISPYWGSDIGGFYPSPEKTAELYTRWFQFGAFCGSFRSHGRTWFTCLPWGWGLSDMGPREDNNKNTPATDTEKRNPLPSELNNPNIEPITRKYDELRYQLMPYTYTLAWEAHTSGVPLMRAMWLHYPNDKKAVALGNQYLWGRDLLIAPVFEEGETERTTYLPEGIWYDWWNGEKITGGNNVTRKVDLSVMPIYVKAGAIIPFDPVRQYTGEKVTEPTTIKVYSGADGQFTLYEDDGISLEYLDGRDGQLTDFIWNDKAQTLTIKAGTSYAEGNTNSRKFTVELFPKGKTKEVEFDSKKRVTVQF